MGYESKVFIAERHTEYIEVIAMVDMGKIMNPEEWIGLFKHDLPDTPEVHLNVESEVHLNVESEVHLNVESEMVTGKLFGFKPASTDLYGRIKYATVYEALAWIYSHIDSFFCYGRVDERLEMLTAMLKTFEHSSRIMVINYGY